MLLTGADDTGGAAGFAGAVGVGGTGELGDGGVPVADGGAGNVDGPGNVGATGALPVACGGGIGVFDVAIGAAAFGAIDCGTALADGSPTDGLDVEPTPGDTGVGEAGPVDAP